MKASTIAGPSAVAASQVPGPTGQALAGMSLVALLDSMDRSSSSGQPASATPAPPENAPPAPGQAAPLFIAAVDPALEQAEVERLLAGNDYSGQDATDLSDMFEYTLRPGESRVDVARLFCSLKAGSLRDRVGLFLYIRERYADDPQAVEDLRSPSNWGIYQGIRLAEAAAEPFGTESYQERLDALVRITALHRKARAWSGDWACSDLAVQHFEQVKTQGREGETFQHLMEDYLAGLSGLASHNSDTAKAIDSFTCVRRESRHREILLTLLKTMVSAEEVRKTLEHFDTLPASPDREERVTLGLEAAAATGRLHLGLSLYDSVDRNAGADRFAEASALMRGILADASTAWPSDVIPAFEYAWTKLGNDPEAIQGFRAMVRGTGSCKAALASHPDVTLPWPDVPVSDRIDLFLRLTSHFESPQAARLFRVLREGGALGDAAEVADQVITAHQLVNDYAGQFDPTSLAGDVVADLLQARCEWPVALPCFLKAVRTVQSGPDALASIQEIAGQAKALVSAPVAGETLEERQAIFGDLCMVDAPGSRRPAEGLADYRLLAATRLQDESLAAAAGRLKGFVGHCQDAETAREAYRFVVEGSRSGRFGTLSPDEVTDQVLASLARDPSLEKAMEWVRISAVALGPPQEAGKVTQDEEWVTLGNIRVRKH